MNTAADGPVAHKAYLHYRITDLVSVTALIGLQMLLLGRFFNLRRSDEIPKHRAFGILCVTFTLCAAYLAFRIATKYGIESAWKRIGLVILAQAALSLLYFLIFLPAVLMI